MRRFMLLFSSIFVGVCLVGSAAGQDSSLFRYASDPDVTSEETTPATETEPAEKESFDSYDSWPTSTKSLVQRKAMFRAQQRELRIAARKWHGYTASRPPVQGNPYYMAAYSPAIWQMGVYNPPNLYGPFGWYFPRRSLSAFQWTPYSYATVVK